MICPIGKPSLTVRISVTDKCQLRCRYCMPAEGVTRCAHQNIIGFEEITGFIERLQVAFQIEKVRLTGGDPLARKGIARLVAMLADLEIPDLAMTTNAQGLAEAAMELRDAGLHRVNISLDSLNPNTFRRITRGGKVERTLSGIDAALQANLRPVKLNMVVMRGINEHEAPEVMSFALERGCELRFLELMPIGYGAELFDEAYMSSDSVLAMLASRFDMEPIVRERGSSAKRYHVRRTDGLCGVAGFISPCSEPFCSGCARLRLTAEGRLIGCLARKDGFNIRPLLAGADDEKLFAVVQQALNGKRSNRRFEQPAAMASIGG